ncbi:MAG: hypothetical protein BZ137_09940 [Methanosphaera sp. rholeuAM130]|nr:MAG: hypothetical protein BZ137_09940 [Methanosphaera sp. rholeuAM130]
MKVSYECASCMLRQSREAIEHATESDEIRMKATLKVLEFLDENFEKDVNSNRLGTDLHHLIMRETGNDDPYKNLREEGNEIALKLKPIAEDIIEDNPSFENYVKIAVAGNIIDFGALDENTDIEQLIREKIIEEPVINDINILENDLKNAENILYLADNGGEIVFDKLLIKKIKEDYDLNIILALKDGPILNDALLEDAKDLNIDEYATLMTTGSRSVGVVNDYISDKLHALLDEVDLIISKGMGNYEGLTEMHIKSPVYFLLTAKCNAIAKEIGVENGNKIVQKRIL